MFIGDGWFSIYIKIDPVRPLLKIVVAFHIIQSTDCKKLLNAFKFTFGEKGVIAPDSAARTAYVYKLEGIKNCLQYIIPLFDQYELPSTKQKQYSIFREVVFLLKDKKHLTPEGLDAILVLTYEFSSLSQGVRNLTIDQQRNLAVLYFRRRNYN